MFIYSGSSSKKLTQKISGLGSLKLGNIEIHRFPDNENRVRVVDDVLDRDVVVVQSTAITPNLRYMELFFILDSLKRSGAHSITLVVPYLGYQRQDHIFRSGEAVSLEVTVDIIENFGIKELISFEFHTVKIPQFFKSAKVKEISALPLFADKIKKMKLNDFVLVSPDMGGIARVKKISEYLSRAPFIAVEKDRDLVTGNIKSAKFRGETKKCAVIVDDVISSGKTILGATRLLLENGVEEIFVMATHGLFAGGASEKLQKEPNIKKVIVTDTIELPKSRKFKKLEVISIADLIVKELKN